MDVHDRLNQLTATVGAAKAFLPMSASCLVNRAEMLDLLERLRQDLPATLDDADALLSDREAVLSAGREEAKSIVERARGERERLIERTEVLLTARARAAAVIVEAQAASARLLADADGYVDRKLGEFEVLLGQLSSQVNNGRLRLTTRREADLARVQEDAQEALHGVEALVDGHPDVVTEPGIAVDPAMPDRAGLPSADPSLQVR